MKVAVLQQYLRSLVEPIKASGASTKLIGDLEAACQGLESFREREFADLAEFLFRAATYEEQGHWPAGRAAPGKKNKELAVSPQELAQRLRTSAETANVQGELAGIERLTVPQLKELMKLLGISGTFKKKQDGIDKIRTSLEGANALQTEPMPDHKLARIVETLNTLKAKADAPDAPFDEIEAELHSQESLLDARDALAAAKALGVVRSMNNRAEALEAIRRKVLEVKLARESIAY